MRILLSAIACHPQHGSESAVGWKCAIALAQKHEVHVLTHSGNKQGIEDHLQSRGLTNPSFVYFGYQGLYHENRLIARGQSWVHYFTWMRESLSQARTLSSKYSFDLIHHVTYSTYRVASPLWMLGKPFVLGPVGGGEKLPWAAAGSMSRTQRFQEVVRVLANGLARSSSKVGRTVRNASALIASNKATAEVLASIRGENKAKIFVFPVVFFAEARIREIRSKVSAHSEGTGHLNIFSSGMLEGRKGLSIALYAVRQAIDAGLSVDFTIPSRGPEFSHLRKLARKLGLSGVVHFPDSLPRDAYWAKLLSSDIYMAPSLRDNCPATLLEAMLSRCVPIVANCNGPGEIVSQDIGEVVEPARLEQMASDIAGRLMRLAKNRPELKRKADAASDYVAANFTEVRYLGVIEEAYAAALSYGGRRG